MIINNNINIFYRYCCSFNLSKLLVSIKKSIIKINTIKDWNIWINNINNHVNAKFRNNTNQKLFYLHENPNQ